MAWVENPLVYDGDVTALFPVVNHDPWAWFTWDALSGKSRRARPREDPKFFKSG